MHFIGKHQTWDMVCIKVLNKYILNDYEHGIKKEEKCDSNFASLAYMNYFRFSHIVPWIWSQGYNLLP